MIPGKSVSPALILRTRFLRISSRTGRTRYSRCRSCAMVCGEANGNLEARGWAMPFNSRRRIRRAPFRSGSKLRQLMGERAQEPEAAGQHHVTVRHRQVGMQGRAREQAPPGSGDREQVGRPGGRAQLERAMAHVLEDLRVADGSLRQLGEVTLQL